jgi:hypothetical protein
MACDGLPLLPDWMDMIRDGQRLNYIKNPDGYCSGTPQSDASTPYGSCRVSALPQ